MSVAIKKEDIAMWAADTDVVVRGYPPPDPSRLQKPAHRQTDDPLRHPVWARSVVEHQAERSAAGVIFEEDLEMA